MNAQITSAQPKRFSSLFESFDKPKLNKLLWELYRGWSYHSAEYADTAEVRDMLVFYEELRELLSDNLPIPAQGERGILLQMLIATIRPKMIFQVIQPGDRGDYVDLVIVVSSRDSRPFSELEPIIELATVDSPRVSCMLYKEDFLNTAIDSGYPYLWWVCTKENLVYSDGDVEIPKILPDKLAALMEQASKEFGAGISRANRFLAFADDCVNTNKGPLGMFMIHQVAEMAFRAIALSFFGIDRGNHSIKSLMKLNRRLAPQMNDAFPAGDEESERLLKILDNAYIDARYKMDYEIAEEDVRELLDRVLIIVDKAVEVFELRIEGFQPSHE